MDTLIVICAACILCDAGAPAQHETGFFVFTPKYVDVYLPTFPICERAMRMEEWSKYITKEQGQYIRRVDEERVELYHKDKDIWYIFHTVPVDVYRRKRAK